MSPSKRSLLQLLLAAVVVICSSVGPLSAANVIEAFAESGSRGSIVGQVVAPQVGDITTASFTTTTTTTIVKTNVRSGSTAADAASGSVLPGGNGFGQVSYNKDASEARSGSSSNSATAPVETQAEYRARIRKAEKEAVAKNPYLRMQNLVSF